MSAPTGEASGTGGGFGAWRNAAQTALAASFLLAPLPGFWGRPLFGLDLVGGRAWLFGAELRASGFFPVLLLCLGGLALFLWAVSVLGRFWCGWACPQSLLADFSTWAGGRRRHPLARGLLLAAASLLLSACLLLLLFPYSTLAVPAAAPYRTPLAAAWLLLALGAYLDMAHVGRSFCKTLCPYGKFLTLAAGGGSAVPSRDPNRVADCIDCARCSAICPMGLDPREGQSAECIACGRCVDACAVVLRRRGAEPGLVRFARPHRPEGRSRLGRQALLAAGIVLFAAALFLLARPPAVALRARFAPEAQPRTTTRGEIAVVLALSVSAPQGSYGLAASGPSGETLDARPATVDVPPEGQAHPQAILLLPPGLPPSYMATLRLLDPEGRERARATLDAGAFVRSGRP